MPPAIHSLSVQRSASSAWLAIRQEHYEQAATYLHEGLAISQAIERDSYRVVALIRTLVQLGILEESRGAFDDALTRYTDALLLMRESGLAGRMLAYCLDGIGVALTGSGDHVRAAHLFGAADAYWRTIRAVPFPFQQLEHLTALGTVRTRVGNDRFTRAWNAGRAMEIEHVFALALGETELF